MIYDLKYIAYKSLNGTIGCWTRTRFFFFLVIYNRCVIEVIITKIISPYSFNVSNKKEKEKRLWFSQANWF